LHHLLFAGLPAHPIPAVRVSLIGRLGSDPKRNFNLPPLGASSGLASPQLRAPSFETYLAQHRWNVRSNLPRSAVR
jgi:hypothetical protein